MGRNDVIMNRWLSDKARFADFVNGALFHGKQVFRAEHLKRAESKQEIVVKSRNGNERAVQKYRDIMMLSEEGTRIVIVACENQNEVHYAMPVRGMLYDALNYSEQIQDIRKKKRKQKKLKGSAEFLSGLTKEDLLVPVITIVFYYGSKDEWDGKEELHGLLGLDREEYRFLKKYIPNYKINLVDPRQLEDLQCFGTDLQMMFGMMKCREDQEKMLEYVHKNKTYFSKMDEESYDAAKVMLGLGDRLKKAEEEKQKEDGGIDMCKALDDWYQSGVQKGYGEGLSEGRSQGLSEGRSQGLSEGRSQGLSEGRSQGLREGRSLGLNEGIEAMILDYQEEGFSREKIIGKLIKRFALTSDVAQSYYEKFSAAA